MHQKKLLLLGGLRYLIPVIQKAKDLGIYTVTCDYLPNNIAHQYSDEFHNISILDKEAVLKLAKGLSIDGILSFAVDPGVLTAAYVAEKLNLPFAGSYEAVSILQNKAKFREFLSKNNFNVPKAKGFTSVEKASDNIDSFSLPVIVKPVDSAGSKGVSKINSKEELVDKINYALSFSPKKEFIIEDFIEQKGFSSDSDSFSVDGKLVYCSFSNQRFDKKAENPYTPSAYSWPSSITAENQVYLKSELQRLIDLLDLKTSVYNIEVRVDKNDKPYIMEVSPRGGGNRLSEMLKLATGTDLIENTVRAAVGLPTLEFPENIIYDGHWAEQILFAPHAGTFQEIKLDSGFKEKYVHELDLWVKKGDQVEGFSAANHAIGTLVMRFKTMEELNFNLQNINQFLNIIITND